MGAFQKGQLLIRLCAYSMRAPALARACARVRTEGGAKGVWKLNTYFPLSHFTSGTGACGMRVRAWSLSSLSPSSTIIFQVSLSLRHDAGSFLQMTESNR